MEIVAEIPQSEIDRFGDELQRDFDSIRQEVQGAMADAYYSVVIQNIGDTGFDRPAPWPPLSPGYAKAVGRKHATLFVTGKLMSAIRKDNSSADAATVSVSDNDCEYAVAHQYGYPPKNLPARPYFPFDPQTGETTPFTLDLIQSVAEFALEKALHERGLA